MSHEAAREEYGVVLDDSNKVDATATETERERIRSERSRDLPQFDHGGTSQVNSCSDVP